MKNKIDKKKNKVNSEILDINNLDAYQPNKKVSDIELKKIFKKKLIILIISTLLAVFSIILLILCIIFFK